MSNYHVGTDQEIEAAYGVAKAEYGRLGVDVDVAIETCLEVPISLHCWQVDDVAGFEIKEEGSFGGGILSTGNHPGRATNADEARADYEKVLSLLPGMHKLNLHASYAETEGKVVDRDEVAPEHFSGWIDWAKAQGIGLDFNPTYYAHPKADSGYTLSNADAGIRDFWITHGVASRRIAERMATELGQPCINNHWVPDGAKDSPADRFGPRARLAASYDKIFDDAHGIDTSKCVDAVESKLFGLGSEDYVVGSMEFYTGYSLTRKMVQCLDMGHYHPTEMVHDKISALFQFHEKLLIHTSRPVRWDSDHVVLFNDDVKNVFLEMARGGVLDRMYIALDFFDASINRVMAYVIGTRATRKAILAGLLDPTSALQSLEREGKLGQKLALMEEQRLMPFGAVWNYLCLKAGTPAGAAWIADAEKYEADVLSTRS